MVPVVRVQPPGDEDAPVAERDHGVVVPFEELTCNVLRLSPELTQTVKSVSTV